MIYIVRHGQTRLNKAHVLQGRIDAELNDNGIKQASDLGTAFRQKGISFDAVYSSPLIRAVETGRLISGGMEPIIDERLIEMEYGPYEGMDLQNPAPEVMAFFSDFVNVPAPDGMEQLSSVVERCGDFLRDLADEANRRNILITTHAIAMKGLLEYLTPDSQGSYWSKHIGNCEVYSCSFDDGRYTVPVSLDI